jgi:hypothetical protein
MWTRRFAIPDLVAAGHSPTSRACTPFWLRRTATPLGGPSGQFATEGELKRSTRRSAGLLRPHPAPPSLYRRRIRGQADRVGRDSLPGIAMLVRN